jgi:murein DD-endopeptidase MepM/ murein hydrolase activator NlpD
MPERNIYLESRFDSPQRRTQGFAENPQIYNQFGMKGHNGIDDVAPDGTPIYPIYKGKVKYADDVTGYGKHIRIFTFTGEKTIETIFAHLKSSNFKTDDEVKSRLCLGRTGNTCYCLPKGGGWHSHFGVREWVGGHCLNYNNGFKGWLDPATYDWGQWKDYLAVPEPKEPTDEQIYQWALSIGLVKEGEEYDIRVLRAFNRYSKINNLK